MWVDTLFACCGTKTYGLPLAFSFRTALFSIHILGK